MHTVAQIILQQLGGNRFIAMTGAKNFVFSDDSLTFTLPDQFAKHQFNAICIELDPTDTYRLTFFHLASNERRVITEYADVYAEDLQHFFTDTTGLDTSL